MYTWGYLKNAALAKLDLDLNNEDEAIEQNMLNRFVFYANEVITMICSTVKPHRTFYKLTVDKDNMNKVLKMPNDFISFGDDVNLIRNIKCNKYEPVYDDVFHYVGYNKICCEQPGDYLISYNARWIKFDSSFDNDKVLDIPDDILECIPSYIASQCYKVDDEYKSAVFRNEFEMLMARIDDTDKRNTSTFKIEGDW